MGTFVFGNSVVEERLFKAAYHGPKRPPFRACGGLKPAISK
jgi:hypothetical protein